MHYDSEGASDAFSFHGNWREFAPIAFTNLLLTIVTLGIYRFWATTRERRYLWSRTQFVDDKLEWHGTGKELFIGFLIVALVILLPLFAAQFVFQALVLQGLEVLAGIVFFAIILMVSYLGGVARFRALRYRLSRTYWHGIRGGSDNPGFGYGLSYLWKNAVGTLVLGLGIPWAMCSLWNERWREMSFGPHRFESEADFWRIMKYFLIFYLAPIVLIVAMLVLAFVFGGMAQRGAFDPQAPNPILVFALFAFVMGIYFLLGVIALAFYAAFFREAVGNLRMGDLEFAFQARFADWFKLLLGDVLLVVATLGVGVIFLSYRHWKFFIVQMSARGEIDLDAMSQSETKTSGHGEGLLDAFDVGAI